MRKLFYFSFCIAGMTGFWYFCKYLITGVSEQFGDGVFVGSMITIVLFYIAERAERRQRGRS